MLPHLQWKVKGTKKTGPSQPGFVQWVLRTDKALGKDEKPRTKKQTIVIYWNFIGAVEIPGEQEKTA